MVEKKREEKTKQTTKQQKSPYVTVQISRAYRFALDVREHDVVLKHGFVPAPDGHVVGGDGDRMPHRSDFL